MAVFSKRISVRAEPETDLVNITEHISRAVAESKIKSGVVNIFVPGSTASVSTIEFEPNLVGDFKDAIERLVPSDIKYRHKETWGDDNGKSHVRATLMGPGLTVPFQDGKLLLGTWQNLIILDFDTKPRKREIVLTVIGE